MSCPGNIPLGFLEGTQYHSRIAREKTKGPLIFEKKALLNQSIALVFCTSRDRAPGVYSTLRFVAFVQ